MLLSKCDINPSWNRQLKKPVHRWYWNRELNGANFRGYNYQCIDPEDAKVIVENAIEWAVDIWWNTVNKHGTVMEDMRRVYHRDSADLEIDFTDLGYYDPQKDETILAGQTPNSSIIHLNYRLI